MIRLENIQKYFDDTAVLKGITMEFEKGKTNLVIGQSGSGKTVLLKILLGLFTPNKGEIYFENTPFSSMTDDEHRTLRREIGMVFQGSALFDSMTVLENVLFPIRMLTKLSESEMIAQAESVIERVNLSDARNKLPNEISGGMQKRVAIARAVVMRPKYLFCDEPNSGLDPKTAIVIDNLIQEITHENNITTVINSHDMNSVMEIGETILFLENGEKEWEGTKDNIFKTDNEAVTDFVYSSNLFKKVRKLYLEN
ncbi:MAG: ATP-binding cassette domain-containing protein [Flavobacteriaceae bacterium]|jgi:phospholipid/cholesterol/gamma-HCH transport system ATP-binding protein|nr:ATP-binding cassette domain-containing protein [Flavobacteriaceae bacterium]